MATGRQYTLSVNLRMSGQEPAKKALDSLSSGLRNVRQNAAGASTAVAASTRSATLAASSWRVLGRASSAALGGIGATVRAAVLLPLRAAASAVGVLKGAMIGAAGAVVGAWLQVKGVLAALRPAAEMEQYSIQLEVLTKSAAVASRRLAQLKEYARTTNFSPKEVIEASNLMQAFGLWTEQGMRRLRAAGDAANAFGKSITEVVTAMNYLSSGRSGEAFEALSRIGVTRQALQPFGLEFKKSGELITEPKKAVDIVFAYLERQFGGMTARQSRTWKGAIQQLGGEVYNSFAEGMQKALRPMTGFVTGKIIPAVNAIGKALKQIDWQKTLAKPLAMLGGLLGAFRLAADPSTRVTGIRELKGLAGDLAAVGKAALSGLGTIIQGLLRDGAAMLEHFVTGGGVQAVFRTLYAAMVSSFRFGVALFRTVLDGFSDKFRSDLASLLPGEHGTYERRKRSQVMAQTFAALYPEEASRIENTYMLQGDRNAAIRRFVGNLQGSARSRWEAEYASRMGWRQGTPNAQNHFEGVLDPLLDAGRGIASRVGGLRFSNTTEAARQAAAGVMDAAGVVGNRLQRLDAMDSVQARRTSLRNATAMRLRRLRMIGWDSRGRVRENETQREAQARSAYYGVYRDWQRRDARLASMLPGSSNAAKEAKEVAREQREETADKAAVQSAVFLDDIRKGIARLVAILGQDFGGAVTPANPQ